MAFVRMYSGDDGESHFEDVALPPKGETLITKPTAPKVTFLSFPDGRIAEFHTTDSRNYVMFLSGGVFTAELGDGARRQFRPGDVCLMEDMTGRGHKTWAEGDCLLAILPMGEE